MFSELAAFLKNRNTFLFDLDGTLVDSSACHERAYLKAMQAICPGAALAFRYELYKGWRTRDAIKDLGVLDEGLINLVTESKQRFYREEVEAGNVELLPCARELLDLMKYRQYGLFLVTGGSRRSTEAVLGRLGLAGFFAAVITGDDVDRCKPAPDCYLQCISQSGISREGSLVIDDALSGIQAAQSAGLNVIAVNNPELSGMPEYAGTLADVYAAIA